MGGDTVGHLSCYRGGSRSQVQKDIRKYISEAHILSSKLIPKNNFPTTFSNYFQKRFSNYFQNNISKTKTFSKSNFSNTFFNQKPLQKIKHVSLSVCLLLYIISLTISFLLSCEVLYPKRLGKMMLGDEDELCKIPRFVLPVLGCAQNVKYGKVVYRCCVCLLVFMFIYLPNTQGDLHLVNNRTNLQDCVLSNS